MQNFYENLIFNLKFIKNSQVASPISHITPFPSWFSTFPTHSTISLSTNTSYKSLFAPLPRNFSFLFLFLSHLRVFVEVMQTNLKFPYVKIILGIEFSLLPIFFVFFLWCWWRKSFFISVAFVCCGNKFEKEWQLRVKLGFKGLNFFKNNLRIFTTILKN